MAATHEAGRGINVGEGSRTSDEAEAHAHAAAGADAEGGAQLAERIRPRHREAPQGAPPPAARHLSPVPTSLLRPLARCARPPPSALSRGVAVPARPGLLGPRRTKPTAGAGEGRDDRPSNGPSGHLREPEPRRA